MVVFMQCWRNHEISAGAAGWVELSEVWGKRFFGPTRATSEGSPLEVPVI